MFLQLLIIISLCSTFTLCQNCPSDGLYPNADCTGFYQCLFTNSAFAQQHYFDCTPGTLFDDTSNTCNWASIVTCNNNNPVSTKPTAKTTINVLTTRPSGKNYLITQSEFNAAVLNSGYSQPTSTQYQNLVSLAGPQGNIFSKLQLAMFLAQILWESDGLKATREYYCYPTFNSGCEYSTGIGYPGQNYYGRGYIQLSWDYNYKAASSSLYGSDTLLKNADQVASIDAIAWGTAFWFWKANVIGGPYGSSVLNGQFGSSTNAINGALECRGQNTDKAKKRFDIYKKVLIGFRVTTIPNEKGCYN